MQGDPLALDAETMRRLGYRTVDMLVDRLTDAAAPPLARATPEEMRRRLAGPPPEGPEELDAILAQLEGHVLPFASRGDHPGFFAFTPFAGTWPGALGDLVASACNLYAGSWMEAAGPSQVELEVIRWFAGWIGYPERAAGTLLSGGSVGNLTALACAREALAAAETGRLVIYLSDQAHSSLARAARILGFRPEQVRVLPAGRDLRLRPESLLRAVEADRADGRRPFLVAANAGATNSGAIDPLPELAAICRAQGLWLHVDGAYGGFAVLTERGRGALEGIDLADSVTLDPHKWLYQPYECGCLLVRDGRLLHDAFAIRPDYLGDAEASAGEVNFADLGIQLSRAARALKVWISIRYFGLDAFRRAIDRSLDLAALARERIEASPELELLAPPSLGILCFRRRFGGIDDETVLERLNGGLIAALEESGLGLVSSTRLHGRFAIRLCILSHTTDAARVETVLDFLERTELAAEPPVAPPAYDRDPGVEQGWLGRPQLEPGTLRLLPLFKALEPEEAERVLAAARERTALAGDPIVEQWEASHDFYVILEGSVEVLVTDERVRELGPGDFFGELAALDWGAGFGYPRLASVRATSRVRLLVLPPESLNQLVRELPSVAEQIRAVARERLGRL